MQKRTMKEKVLDWIQSSVVEGRPPNSVGPKEFANGGWTGIKPWAELYSEKGIFRGNDGSVWAFFKTPENVNTAWLSSPEEGVNNQLFLNNVIEDLGVRLDRVSQNSLTRDLRRGFRLSIIRSEFDHLYWDEKHDKPATKQYRSAMSEKITRPEWDGYFGVELLQSKLGQSATTLSEAAEWFKMGHEDNYSLFMDDYADVLKTMVDNGFRPLTELTVDSDDYKNLTAWHGVEPDGYNVQRHVESTRFQEPVDGYSVVTPRWGEISFYAAVPSEERHSFGDDPQSESARWARPFYHPENSVVGIWVEGEIRSDKIARDIIRAKRYGRMSSAKNVDPDDIAGQEKLSTDMDHIRMMDSVSSNLDLVDNCEILVAVQCFAEEKHTLRDHLRRYGMDARMPVSRQAKCLARTMPCYPDGISKIYRNNFLRGHFSTQMFPGALSMSGILQRTRPNCNNGVLMGLTNQDYEYREVFTTVDGATKEGTSPVMLITGRQGSGKTMQGLQMMIQVVYDERPVVFLNPKPDSSFGHLFNFLGGATVTMSHEFLQENPGMLDPFAFFVDRDDVFKHLDEAIKMAIDADSDIGVDARGRSMELSANLKNNIQDTRNKCSADVIFGNKAGREGYQDAIDSLNAERRRRHIQRKKDNGWVVTKNQDGEEDLSGILDDFTLVTDGNLDDQDREYVKEFLHSINGTPPIPEAWLRKTIRNMINVSPVWMALIGDTDSGSELAKILSKGKPVLIEWDGTMDLPKDTSSIKNMTRSNIDSVISVTLAFKYAEEIITKMGNGGLLAIDEAWTLKGSESVRASITGISREGRERNIMMLLMTQRIADFMDEGDDNLASGISRFLFMSTPENDIKERQLFFEHSGWDDDDAGANWAYMVNAGIKSSTGGRTKKSIAEGYYVDKIYGFSGALLCGPWPDLELNMARTDPEGKKWQRAYEQDKSLAMDMFHDSQYHVTSENFMNLVVSDQEEEEFVV